MPTRESDQLSGFSHLAAVDLVLRHPSLSSVTVVKGQIRRRGATLASTVLRAPSALASSSSPAGGIVDILTWIIVGLVAGVLASLVMGGTGYGIIGDIIIGIVGAFVGGWLFVQLGVTTPFAGLAGTIFTAFIGAVVLLFLLRLIRTPRRRRI
jgi:uncharacterized membrane protein YeaQ/YmgE (transglycosylase-associated protein family)